MINESGQLNCFINTIIQIFWHTDSLKQIIANFSGLMKSKQGQVGHKEHALMEEVRVIFEKAYDLNVEK